MRHFTISARNIFFLFTATLMSFFCGAQESVFPTRQQLDMEDFAVSPCGQSTHLESLIRKTIGKDTSNKDYFFRTVRLSDSDFISLTPLEKFLYAHQYPESYMQNCSWYNPPKGLSKLYANLPFITSGLKMSKRQLESLKNNRDSTVGYIEKCIKNKEYIALGYKQTIVDLNAWELLPLVMYLEGKMSTGRDESLKDTHLYTVMMQLMRNNDFPDFKKATFYNELYGKGAGYRKNIDLTMDIRRRIVELTENFYRYKISERR